MRKFAIALLFVVSVIFVAAPVMADWKPNNENEPWNSTNHKMHFPQLPDLTENGMDILATWPYWDIQPGTNDFGKILADDWRCSESGVVSDIHIWGSWNYDELPFNMDGVEDPHAVGFKLSIHKDIPAGTNDIPYSRPGEQLWSDWIQPYDPRMQARPIALPAGIQETFYDPNLQEPIGYDTVVWQYNFFLKEDPTTEPLFRQEEGEIYWLDLQAFPVEDPDGTHRALFGWKTSDQNLYPEEYLGRHFQDDAVFADNIDPGQSEGLNWRELYYPGTGVPPRSLDLAFVITPEPSTWAMLLMAGFVALTTYVWRRR